MIDSIQILRLLLYFIIYSFFGWVLESIFKSIIEKKIVNSGFLHGPFCPIYGIGAMIMILFLSKLNNVFLIFIVSFFVLSVWEYLVAVLLEKKFNTKYWDYTGKFLNIKGRVCFMNSTYWGGLGVIFTVLIHPFLEKYVLILNNQIIICLDIVFLMIIIIDTIVTCYKIKSMDNVLSNIKDLGNKIKEKLKELKELKNVKEENVIEKIRNIEHVLDELKIKEDILKLKLYKQADRLKKAFPTMKSEKISNILKQKVELKEIKKKIKNRVNKRTRR